MTAAATPRREELRGQIAQALCCQGDCIRGEDACWKYTTSGHKKITDAIVAIFDRLAAKPADDGWQDISNAPRDGTAILATGGGLGNEIEIVNYNERVGCWDAPNDTLDDRDDEPQGYNRPTLWQPIPARSSTTGEPKR